MNKQNALYRFGGLRASKLLTAPFLYSALVLGACAPTKVSKPQDSPAANAPTTLSTQNQAAANCEEKLRAQMENKSLLLTEVAPLVDDIRKLNAESSTTNETSYGFRRQKNQNVEISLMHDISDRNNEYAIKYSLSLTESSKDRMHFSSSISKRMGNHLQVVSQEFRVSEACDLALSSTSHRTIDKTANGYDIKESMNYSDGGLAKEDFAVTLASNDLFMPFIVVDRLTLKTMPETIYSANKATGLITFKAGARQTRKIRLGDI
ncbi:MAG: hypothetical protein EOP06_25055, partial [Proteobacteria bacterium]